MRNSSLVSPESAVEYYSAAVPRRRAGTLNLTKSVPRYAATSLSLSVNSITSR